MRSSQLFSDPRQRKEIPTYEMRENVSKNCRRLMLFGATEGLLALVSYGVLFQLAGAEIWPTLVSVVIIAPLIFAIVKAKAPLHKRILGVSGTVPKLPEGAQIDADRIAMVYPVIINAPKDVRVLAATIASNREAARAAKVRHHIALVDFQDAPTPIIESDAKLEVLLANALMQLESETTDIPIRVLYLVRRRRWSDSEQAWIGWERKRGKLMEFCALALGEETSWIDNSGPKSALSAARGLTHVVSVDMGSRFVGKSIDELVRTALHPANQAKVSLEGKVTSGYTYFRPGTASHNKPDTWFERVAFGLTPFEEGPAVLQRFTGTDAFFGEGVIDLAAAYSVLGKLLPEGEILSHDTLEGSLAGAIRVERSFLIEPNPAAYSAYISRQHRWARGDVQLIPWVLGKKRRTLTLWARWNLGGAIVEQWVPASSLGSLVWAWLCLPSSSALIFTIGLCLLPVVDGLYYPLKNALSRGRISQLRFEIIDTIAAEITFFALLADQAVTGIDATLRALYRMRIKRRLLEWQPDERAAFAPERLKVTRHHWLLICVVGLLCGAVASYNCQNILISLLFSLLWICGGLGAPLLNRRYRSPGSRFTY